jgi:hypothetical protein
MVDLTDAVQWLLLTSLPSRQTIDRAADGSTDHSCDRRICHDHDAATCVQGIQQNNESDGCERRTCG